VTNKVDGPPGSNGIRKGQQSEGDGHVGDGAIGQEPPRKVVGRLDGLGLSVCIDNKMSQVGLQHVRTDFKESSRNEEGVIAWIESVPKGRGKEGSKDGQRSVVDSLDDSQED